MSDAVANLRALALSRITQDHPLHVVLDDDLRAELNAAREAHAVLLAKRAELERDGNLPPKPAPASLADVAAENAPTADVDKMLTVAAEVLTSIEDEALESGKVLVLHFRRLDAAAYQVEVDKAEVVARKAAAKDRNVNQNARFLDELGDALTALCYTSASTPAGDDVGLTLDELLANVLDHADVDALRAFTISINRAGQAVPFTTRNSGLPVTN